MPRAAADAVYDAFYRTFDVHFDSLQMALGTVNAWVKASGGGGGGGGGGGDTTSSALARAAARRTRRRRPAATATSVGGGSAANTMFSLIRPFSLEFAVQTVRVREQ